MLKASNETKIGILAAVTIVMLISGCDFLKGKNLLLTARLFMLYIKA